MIFWCLVLVGKDKTPFCFFKKKGLLECKYLVMICNKISYLLAFVGLSFQTYNQYSWTTKPCMIPYLVCMYALYSFKWFFVLDNGQPTVARGRFQFLVSQWISLFRCARNRNPSWGRACFWMNSNVSALFFRLHHTRVSKNNSLVL